MPGQTSSELVISKIRQTDSGNYSVIVENAFGKAVSNEAVLTVESSFELKLPVKLNSGDLLFAFSGPQGATLITTNDAAHYVVEQTADFKLWKTINVNFSVLDGFLIFTRPLETEPQFIRIRELE